MSTVLACALTAVALAGCTSPHGPAVASVDRSAAPTTVTPGQSPTVDTDYDKALRYTRCLTANGFPAADPVVGQMLPMGNIIYAGESADQMGQRMKAYDACKKSLPATWPVKETPSEIAKAKAFAECMRDRNFPQLIPDADGLVHQPTDPAIYSTPEYEAALAACRHLYDDPANNQG